MRTGLIWCGLRNSRTARTASTWVTASGFLDTAMLGLIKTSLLPIAEKTSSSTSFKESKITCSRDLPLTRLTRAGGTGLNGPKEAGGGGRPFVGEGDGDHT